MDSVGLDVGEAVAVWIHFKGAETLDLNRPVMREEILTRDTDYLTLLKVLSWILSSKDYPTWTPRKLITKRIIVRIRSRKAATIRGKANKFATACPDLVDYLHC